MTDLSNTAETSEGKRPYNGPFLFGQYIVQPVDPVRQSGILPSTRRVVAEGSAESGLSNSTCLLSNTRPLHHWRLGHARIPLGKLLAQGVALGSQLSGPPTLLRQYFFSSIQFIPQLGNGALGVG